MHYQRSAIDVAGRSARRVRRERTILIVSPARVAPRPGRRPALGTRSVRKPRIGAMWLALTLSLAVLPAAGQAQTVEWAQSAGGTSIDQALGIAADAAGNSYVTGSYQGTATFGPFTITSAGSFDIFVAKYDSSGNVLWVRSAGGTVDDWGFAIAVDAAGNSYVTGRFEGTATFGPFMLTTVGVFDEDIFVAKYDASGNVLWAESAGSTFFGNGLGIALDAAGNSYLTGQFSGAVSFGPFTITGGGSFVAKYDTNGNALWAESASSSRGFSIAVDTASNSYVTGQFGGTATFGPFTLTSAGGQDIYVAKYDASGNVVWARSAGGTTDDQLFREAGIAVDAAGNSYVTGAFTGTATFGSFMLTSAGAEDIYVAKYDAGGTVLWAESAGGTSSNEVGAGIGVDVAGNSYVTGIYQGTAEFGSFTLITAGARDVFVAQYDGGGNVLWVRSAGGTAFDQGNAIAVDDDGTSYVAGVFQGTPTFGAFPLTSAGSADIFVAKYNTCGNAGVDPGEECDGGLGCTDCLCDAGFEPTAPPSLDCQPICGNNVAEPGEQCDATDDAACPGLCRSDCTCPEIPTVSEWAALVMLLVLLVAGTIVFAGVRRGRSAAA